MRALVPMSCFLFLFSFSLSLFISLSGYFLAWASKTFLRKRSVPSPHLEGAWGLREQNKPRAGALFAICVNQGISASFSLLYFLIGWLQTTRFQSIKGPQQCSILLCVLIVVSIFKSVCLIRLLLLQLSFHFHFLGTHFSISSLSVCWCPLICSGSLVNSIYTDLFCFCIHSATLCFFVEACNSFTFKVMAGRSTSWNQDCPRKYQKPQICRWHQPYGRKWKGTKKPLDESESGEWKSWLKAQHSENEDHGIQSHHFMGNRRETVETVSDFIFLGSQITAAMKLKDAYSLERKLWPT